MPNEFNLNETKNQHNWHTVKTLCKFLWPKDRYSLRVRVVLSLICLILAKVLTISIPFFYKYAVNTLSIKSNIIVIPKQSNNPVSKEFFGYDYLLKRESINLYDNLPIPDNYLLGPGDEIIINIWVDIQLQSSSSSPFS